MSAVQTFYPQDFLRMAGKAMCLCVMFLFLLVREDCAGRESPGLGVWFCCTQGNEPAIGLSVGPLPPFTF